MMDASRPLPSAELFEMAEAALPGESLTVLVTDRNLARRLRRQGAADRGKGERKRRQDAETEGNQRGQQQVAGGDCDRHLRLDQPAADPREQRTEQRAGENRRTAQHRHL